MKDESVRNISNIKVSKECYIEMKVVSIRQQMTIQEVAASILEKSFSRKMKKEESTETA
jgi:hypothetical protein